jgi:hypothetical protein
MKSTSSILYTALLLCFLISSIASLKKFKTRQSDCWAPNQNNFEYRTNWNITGGKAIMTFKSWGADFHIRFFDANWWYTYTLNIGGLGNTQTRVLGPNGETLCSVSHTLNYALTYNWKLLITFPNNVIELRDTDSGEMWYCNPNNPYYMPSMPFAAWFGFSRTPNTVSTICDVVNLPWTNQPGGRLVSSFAKR